MPPTPFPHLAVPLAQQGSDAPADDRVGNQAGLNGRRENVKRGAADGGRRVLNGRWQEAERRGQDGL